MTVPKSAATAPELFDWQGYPESPGFKVSGGTSEEAAKAIAPIVRGLRADVLAQIRECPGTADEIAFAIHRSPFSVRPRLTELHRMGLIVPTGERRKHSSGMTANVWAIAPDAPTVASPPLATCERADSTTLALSRNEIDLSDCGGDNG